MRIDNVGNSRQPLILAKEKNLLQAGRRRRGGVGQIGGGAVGVQGALHGASCSARCKECKVQEDCKVQGVQAAGTKRTLLPAVSQTISVPMIFPDFW